MDNYHYDINSRYPEVVSYARGDVNGDRIPDQVYLMGIQTVNSPFIQSITLVVEDGRTGRIMNIPLRENAGYNPTLFLGDFTGDRVNNILIRIDSGGSGATIYASLFSFIYNNPRLLLDSDQYNAQYKYEVQYKNDYKVDVNSKSNQKTYIIDISQRGNEYLNEIYNREGKLKKPIEGFVNPISGLYPVDFDSNGVYELLAFQKIAGRYNADALGYIENVLKWGKDRFVLDNQYTAIFGTSE